VKPYLRPTFVMAEFCNRARQQLAGYEGHSGSNNVVRTGAKFQLQRKLGSDTACLPTIYRQNTPRSFPRNRQLSIQSVNTAIPLSRGFVDRELETRHNVVLLCVVNLQVPTELPSTLKMQGAACLSDWTSLMSFPWASRLPCSFHALFALGSFCHL